MKLAVYLAAAFLSAAAVSPAIALPASPGEVPLAQVSEAEDNAYFVEPNAPTQAGNLREVWVFVVFKDASDGVIGGWRYSRIDCQARSITHLGAELWSTEFRPVHRDTEGQPTKVVPPGTVDDTLLDHVCKGAVELANPVSGPREAVRLFLGKVI